MKEVFSKIVFLALFIIFVGDVAGQSSVHEIM